VLVGWISAPSVFQKTVYRVQLWVLEVKSDSHDDGERSEQGVVIVVVIVDVCSVVILLAPNSFLSIDAESGACVKVMIDVLVEFVTDDCQSVVCPGDTSRGGAGLTGILVS